jgi:thiamine biosynthesis protein ThiS
LISLQINGEDKTLEGEVTVAELLRQLSVETPTVAVEVNREIVPKSAYEAHQLQQGDRIEIVTFVGGG